MKTKVIERFDALDGLRTYAAIGVLVMHVWANAGYNLGGANYIVQSFGLFVFLFMIISAFSMCIGYYDRIINNKISLNEFYTRRYQRVWPFFAILCVIDLVLAPSVESLYETFTNLTMCFGFVPNPYNISVIGVGWFLGVVFVFYMLFPFFCYLISDNKRAWFVFAISILLNYISATHFGANKSNFIYSAVFFVAGGIIYLYRGVLVEFSKRHRIVMLMLCVLFTVLFYQRISSIILMLLLYSIVLIYAIGTERRGILINKGTKFISAISMEIYLSHMVIYRGLEKIGVVHMFGNGWIAFILISILTLIGTIIFSIIVNKVISKIMR